MENALNARTFAPMFVTYFFLTPNFLKIHFFELFVIQIALIVRYYLGDSIYRKIWFELLVVVMLLTLSATYL